jgi:hypothetical protein
MKITDYGIEFHSIGILYAVVLLVLVIPVGIGWMVGQVIQQACGL